MNRITGFFGKLLGEGGLSSSKFINIGVFFVLSVSMLKLAWHVTSADEMNMWFWACFTTLAVYGMGVATFNKWLGIIGAKLGVREDKKEA